MSDITYSRRADDLLAETIQAEDASREYGFDVADQSLAKAGVNATLAVARAAREIDDKLKYVAKVISDAIPKDDSEKWITWKDSGGGLFAVGVRHIVEFYGRGDHTILILTSRDQVTVPLSYGNVALQVGA